MSTTTKFNPITSTLVNRWQFSTTLIGGAYYIQPPGAELHFQVTGTTVTIDGYPQTAQPWDVYVDGTLQTRPTYGSVGTNQTNLVIASGLSDAAHTIRIVYLTYNGFNNITGNTLGVTSGGTPAIALPSTETANVDLAAQPSNVDYGWGYTFGDQLGPGGVHMHCAEMPPAFLDAPIRVNGNGTTLQGFVYQDGTTWSVNANGVDLLPFTTANTGTWGMVTFGTIAVATTCDWTIGPVTPATTSANSFCIANLMITGGTGITSSAITALKKILCVGDSITRKVGQPGPSPAPNTRNGYGATLGRILKANVTTYGQSGSAVTVSATGAATTIAAVGTNLDEVIQLWGTNDAGGFYQSSLYPVSSFTTALTSELTTLLGLTITRINLLALFYRGDGPSNTLMDTYSSAIQNVITAKGSTKLVFRDYRTKIALSDLSVDTLHLTDGGDAKLAVLLANDIGATPIFAAGSATAATHSTGQSLKNGTTVTLSTGNALASGSTVSVSTGNAMIGA